MAASITYGYPMTETVDSVKIDGVALTVQTRKQYVDSNAGSYYHDSTNSILYVSDFTGTVFGKSVIAVADIKLATKSKVFSDEYYDPRITGIPAVSMRIEKRFKGVGQISAGNLDLANLDGVFDPRFEYLWNNADTKIALKLGYDTATDEMAYGSYVDFGVWQVDKWTGTDKKFSLSLAEKKALLKKSLLVDRYNLTAYPSLDEDDVGEPIQRAYGQIYGARAVLINSSTKTFKVAGHTIKTFDEVRLLNNEVWATSTFTTTDLTNGEFTCTSWVDGDEISVDFKGRVNADDTLMDNASDVVSDLLTFAGIAAADVDSTALTTAYNRLDYGLKSDTTRGTDKPLSVYLSDDTELVDILGKINSAVGSFLISAPDGTFHYKVFEPTPGESLTEYDETDCLSFTPITEVGKIASKVFARYGKSDGKSLKLFKITLPAKAMSLLPGDQIHVSNSRRSFDGVLEILQMSINFGAGTVSCLCGNLREWGAVSGFWVSDSSALPTRFSAETGYGSGSNTWNSSWSDTIKNWAKQNVGYWTDANGFADSSDPDSCMESTWI